MKKTFLSLVFTAFAMLTLASGGFEVKYERLSDRVCQLDFSIGEYHVSQVILDNQRFSQIGFEGRVTTKKAGFAELPYVHASVMIGPEKNMTLVVVPGDYEDIRLEDPLVPSRGVIYRSQDPAQLPYVIDPKSVVDEWYPASLADVTDPFILRDVRGVNIYFYPFQYNASQHVLRVYKNARVMLVENDTPSSNPLVKQSQVILREMDAIYRDVFINYAETASRDDLTIGEVGDILVVTTDRDLDAIQPYIDWKTEKGYFVDTEVVTAGTNINSLVQDAYDANSNLLYVLLVGDWADIKCNTLSSGAPMDPQVGCVVGTDEYPDITVGRFSANSPSDVTTQVNKVIAYEKTPEMGGTWYAVATGMASAEGAGIGDDGEADIAHNNIIWNDKLDPFTYASFNQIYDPGATAAMVTTAVNNGTGILNYCGHGSAQSWGTTGFSNSNVAALTNGDKLPFIFSVACDNGDFHTGTCFAEAWMRKSGGGAIMFLGGSISQPWDPPMRGQDYFNDILIGGYDYTAHPGQNGISTSEQRTTLGAVVFNGLVLMCVESGGSSDWETAKTWNIFGDPATQARTATPAGLLLSSNLVMVGVPFGTTVSTSEGPVENAMVALSQNGQMFRGLTDASGNVTFNHTLEPGTAKLVVTAFNTGTIYEDVSVVPASGPYVMLSAYSINDAGGNNNGLLDYGETVYLTVGLANVGSADATGVEATLSCSDAYMNVLDNAATFGTIPAGDTVYVTDAFQVSAADSIPDRHVVIFMVDAAGDGSNNWTSSFGTIAHAPVLAFTGFAIDDSQGNGNGRLDPGETAGITLTVANSGSSDAFTVNGSLSTTNTNVTVNGNPAAFGDLAAGSNASQTFEVVVSETTPAGEMAAFEVALAASLSISGSGSFELCIGQIPVLVLDFDPNKNSAVAIEQCLSNLVVGYEAYDAFPGNLSLYTSVFVCLGSYPDNHVLTADEGQVLADYLNAGGRLYMEGEDTWYYDQQFTPTAVHPMFGLRGLSDGDGNLSTEIGQPGSIADGLSFSYAGDNSYVDQITEDGGVLMFLNQSPEYGTAVSYDAGTYRTVGFSMEFGGLSDGEVTRDDLMIRILDFFGVPGIWTSVGEPGRESGLSLQVAPNPTKETTTIRFELLKDEYVNLAVYNLNGQVVEQLVDGKLVNGEHQIIWRKGEIAPGLYVVRLQNGRLTSAQKVIVEK